MNLTVTLVEMTFYLPLQLKLLDLTVIEVRLLVCVLIIIEILSVP